MAFGALFVLAYLGMRWIPMIVGSVLALRARRHCPRGSGMVALAFLMMLGSEILPLILSAVSFGVAVNAAGPGAGGGSSPDDFAWQALFALGVTVLMVLMTLGSWVLLLLGVFSRRIGMLSYLAAQAEPMDEGYDR